MSGPLHHFVRSAALGAWAVEQVAALYRDQGYVPVDVQGDSFYRSLDIDLVVLEAGASDGLRVEVKGDRWPSKNIYIERIANLKKSAPGCLTYTCSDVVVYYFVKEGQALVIPTVALQEWIERRLLDFPEKLVRNGGKGSAVQESKGHTVPVTTITAEVPGTHWMRGLPKIGES